MSGDYDPHAAAAAAAVCDLGAVRDLVHRADGADHLRIVNARMKADLDAAARIQRSLLPRQSPLMPGVRFAWEVLPCDELAGDVLDVFPLDRDNLALYVVDVSGHGVSAAMLGFTIHKLLSSPSAILTRRGEGDGAGIVPPSHVLRQLNALLPMDPETRLYATLIYGVLNVPERRLRFASAGHCPPVLTLGDGRAAGIPANGFPIGALPDVPYEDHVVDIPIGGRVYLHTDGLVEAGDGERVVTQPWLLRTIAESAAQPVDTAVSSVLARARDRHLGGRFTDDVSLLVVELG